MTAHFTKLRHRNCTVLETPHTAVKPPRKSVAIITSIGFAPIDESAANKRPVWRICPQPVCGFELLLRCLNSRFRLKYRGQTISKKNRGSRKNSHFNDIKHAPYKLTHLIRKRPFSLFKLYKSDAKMRQIAQAAANHARNASDMVLFGLEAIGKPIFIASANSDHKLDRANMGDLGALITHLAAEAQAMRQTDSDIRFALQKRPLKIAGGKE